MIPSTMGTVGLKPGTRDFYRRAIAVLNQQHVPFLIGGAYALERYTGIERHTKDIDLFVRPADAERTLHTLAEAGYHTELTSSHWLGKAFHGGDFVDVIFRSGNGAAAVDDSWFEHAEEADVLDCRVLLCPAEEIIWQKAYVAERERYDGADIAHLLRARAEQLDWPRLLHRFGEHWRILLSHLILFGFVYPAERHRIPASVMRELLDRLDADLKAPSPAAQVCQGTLLSRAQYLIDVGRWGYQDARLGPGGTMTEQQVAQWTAAIDHTKL
jgi:putative nucleotidyltransferase-like protein